MRSASQNGTNARKQFRECERLRQVIVSAEVESFDSVAQLIPGGQEDRGCQASFCSKPPQDCPAIQSWQHDIEQKEIVIMFERQSQTFGAVLCHINRPAMIPQSVTQKGRSFRFVLNNKRSLWLLEHSSA